MDAASKTILIADDEEGLRKVFATAFERAGYRTLIARDGGEAMRILESERVDVVLLDILMPGRDGIETLLEIRRRFPDLYVFVMSGGSSAGYEYLEMARKLGATAAVRKPFLPSKLVELVNAAVWPDKNAAAS